MEVQAVKPSPHCPHRQPHSYQTSWLRMQLLYLDRTGVASHGLSSTGTQYTPILHTVLGSDVNPFQNVRLKYGRLWLPTTA